MWRGDGPEWRPLFTEAGAGPWGQTWDPFPILSRLLGDGEETGEFPNYKNEALIAGVDGEDSMPGRWGQPPR